MPSLSSPETDRNAEAKKAADLFSQLQAGRIIPRQDLLWLFTKGLAESETRQDRLYR